MSAEEAVEARVSGEDDVDATIRSNDFSLVMSGMSNLKFDLESHAITGGQPWQGISEIKCSESGCTMTIMAGRKGSSGIAQWFTQAVMPGSAIGCDTYDAMPDKLNFAFKGTMSFDQGGKTFKGSDIVIAQGHNARSRNNWWIGGPHMSVVTTIPGFLACAAQDFSTDKFPGTGKVTFMTSIGHESSMQMGVLGP